MTTTADPQSVSVVMPCYNGQPFLRQSLDSALAQTHTPHELIIVDDGSSDDSAEFIRAYIDQHSRQLPGGIHLIQQANAGEPAARNRGIDEATGDWVAALDTDDWWEPEKLERQLGAARLCDEQLASAHAAADLKGPPPHCVLVHTAVARHLPDGTVQYSGVDDAARRVGHGSSLVRALLEPGSIGHPSILVRRDALTTIDGYNPEFKQACDIDLYFRLTTTGAFAFVESFLLNYRYHAGQMSAARFTQMTYHFRAVREFFDANPQMRDTLGDGLINDALARLVGAKLESYYWRRQLDAFRQLIEFADQQNVQSPIIEQWRRRARWPDWIIHLKDRLTGRRAPA